MSFQIDNNEVARIGRSAGAMPLLPMLEQPLPPGVAGLGQRLAQSGQPPLTREVVRQMMQSPMPKAPLVSAMPTLSTLASLHVLTASRLGMPLPAQQAQVKALMESLDPKALAPIANMPLGPLSRMAYLLNLRTMLRNRLNVDPLDADAASRINSALPPLTQPSSGPPEVMARLGEANQLGMLSKVAQSLGANLSAPGGVSQLSSAIRPLLGTQLPVLPEAPALLPRLAMVAAINQNWPINTMGATMPSLVAQLNGLRNLAVPAGPAATVQPLPSAATIQSALAVNPDELAGANWKIPPRLPIEDSLPGLNLLALLKDLGPVIKPA